MNLKRMTFWYCHPGQLPPWASEGGRALASPGIWNFPQKRLLFWFWVGKNKFPPQKILEKSPS